MKKIISIALTIILLLSLGAMSVSAADKTIDGTPDSGTTAVNYTFEASYTVTIPESIAADTSATAIDGVKVTAMTIGSAETLTISRTANTTSFTLANGGNNVAATLAGTASVNVNYGDTINVNIAFGTVQVTGTPAVSGTYTGNLTFTCAVS